MKLSLQARVRDGRLLLDEQIDLPDGTLVELVPVDDGDALDDADRERLHAALALSADQFARGEAVPAEEVLRRLRNR